MQIKQFEDKHLAHFSYAILSDEEHKIILVDPARDPKQYIEFAKDNNAEITGVIETHSHADFVSGHLELHNATGATIYASELMKASFPHETFDGGQIITFGEIKLFAINTPGHSPDSIGVILEENARQAAVFTGDTLLIGDCGRPDLREHDGDERSKRVSLAKEMYHSLKFRLIKLPKNILVYPAHGAGSLCGKSMREENSSTIDKEIKTNWSLQEMSEDEFVKKLLEDQPFIPQYFSWDVQLNLKGASSLDKNISKIKIRDTGDRKTVPASDNEAWIIDTRDQEIFKAGHYPRSINLMEDGNFETWLGAIIKPGERFYIASNDRDQIQRMLKRAGSIGYETSVIEGLIGNGGDLRDDNFDVDYFNKHKSDYSIVDVRNNSEVNDEKIFSNSISIPLHELRKRLADIPLNKPILVHCSGGYRSAAASSMIQSKLKSPQKVIDMGELISLFQE